MGGPTEEEKEAVRKRFAEMKAAKSNLKHPKEKYDEEKQKQKDAKLSRLSPAEQKALQEEEMILRKPAESWQDHALCGMIHYQRGRIPKSYECMRTAYYLNSTDLIPLGYLSLITSKKFPFIPDLDRKLSQKILDLPKDFLEFTSYQDRLVLYRGVYRNWATERREWLPQRFQDAAQALHLTIWQLPPSPLLIELAKRIDNADLKNDHWTFGYLSKFSVLLKKAGLVDMTPEEYIVAVVKIYLERRLT